MTTVWQISQMERTLADGGVVVATGELRQLTVTSQLLATALLASHQILAAPIGWITTAFLRSWRCHGAGLTVLTRTLLRHHWLLTGPATKSDSGIWGALGLTKKGEMTMAEKKTTPISVDGVEYVLEDMSPEQQTMVNHITDLDRKVRSTQFNLDQLNVGKQAFVEMLSRSLKEPVFEPVE
jgi:hypothetical protein